MATPTPKRCNLDNLLLVHIELPHVLVLTVHLVNLLGWIGPALGLAQPAVRMAQPTVGLAQPALRFTKPAAGLAQPAVNFGIGFG